MSEVPRSPFVVKDSALITLALGRSAQNLRELRDGIASIPVQSLYHHFYENLLRPWFDDPEFRNDFAQWARHQLHDPVLAERLGICDPVDYEDGEAFREVLVEILEDRLAEVAQIPVATPGREFQFLRSQIVIFDTGLHVATPAELAGAIPTLRPGSIFFHFVEARFRPPRGLDDFSAWLSGWGEQTAPAIERLREVDVLFGSLADMRREIASALAPLAESVKAGSR
jgi:hypothetical protein